VITGTTGHDLPPAAQPAASVPVLALAGPGLLHIDAGGSALITVRAAPLAAVTFVSRDGGIFHNEAAVITVRADAAGLATARFTATPGTVNGVAIQISSPAASGLVAQFLEISAPREIVLP
jgi:hypothetical protein